MIVEMRDCKMLVTDKQYAMEPRLVEKLDLMIDRMTGNNKDDNVVLVDGDEGCLSGDTEIQMLNEKKVGGRLTIEILYNRFKDKHIPFSIYAFDGKKMILHKINNVVFSGVKKVYRLILKGGLSIKATADHKFLTKDNEWVELQNLSDKEIYCMVVRGYAQLSKVISIKYVGEEKTYDIQCEEPHHNFVANGIVVHNSGKTQMGFGICYYISQKTGRSFDSDTNVFFDLDKLFQFALKTEEQILDWDEGALGGLAIEWWKKNQQRFLKLLMVCRKKRHFFIICIPKFFKLNETLATDRSIALIHTYARRNIEKGRFFYYTKKKKEKLFEEWARSKKKSYTKYKSFSGTFPSVEGLVYDEKRYDAKKNEGILSLDDDGGKKTKADKYKTQLAELRYKVSHLDLSTREILAAKLGIHSARLREWAIRAPEEPENASGSPNP